MHSNNDSPDVNVDIGGKSLHMKDVDDFVKRNAEPFERDHATNKLAADVIIGMLPVQIKTKIKAITLARGMNRNTRRATKVLVRQGIDWVNRDRAKLKKRADERDDRERALFLAIEKRVKRGVDKPFPGMSVERYEALKNAFGRVESVKIDGQEVPGTEGALVRIKDRDVQVG